jgi:hypothetical protein
LRAQEKLTARGEELKIKREGGSLPSALCALARFSARLFLFEIFWPEFGPLSSDSVPDCFASGADRTASPVPFGTTVNIFSMLEIIF